MKRAFRHKLMTSAISVSCALVICSAAFAAEKGRVSPPGNDAAKSLEEVLIRAGEQGLLSIEDKKDHTEKHDTTDAPRTKVADPEINCKIASALDLSFHQSVNSLDDIPVVKASLEKSTALEDVLPLAKTYMALALGTELSSLVRNYDGPDARLLESIGHLIDGYASEKDRKNIEQYSACSAEAGLWSLLAQASDMSGKAQLASVEISHDEYRLLEELPGNLYNQAALRLGIHAAEQKSEFLADRILKAIAPESRYGNLPQVKDDDRLYFYALVRQMKGDPVATQIFEELAQFDGIYRTRSLQRLADDSAQTGTKLYSEFSNDLEAVSQQYNGQSESRQAVFQIVRQHVDRSKLIKAIELTKSEFSPVDAEYSQAVAMLAEHLRADLTGEPDSKRLYALNTYFYDPPLFSHYEHLTALKSDAQTAAINLNLPELVAAIFSGTDELNAEQKKYLTFADIKFALKQGQYSKAVELARPYRKDPQFQPLLLKAAIRSGNNSQAHKILQDRPADIDRFERQVDLAWQNGAWREARIALEAIAHIEPDHAITKKIAIVNFVGIEARAYLDSPIPSSAIELDLLSDKLKNDITLVRGFLSNG